MVYKAGTKITVKPTAPGFAFSAPAAVWLTSFMDVKLKEDAISGTWDVFDVELPDGSEQSIYGFNISGLPLMRVMDSKERTEVRYTVNDILCDDLLPTHRKVDKIMELIHSIM